MKITIKEANGLNLTKGKLYTVIQEDWKQAKMTALTIWAKKLAKVFGCFLLRVRSLMIAFVFRGKKLKR